MKRLIITLLLALGTMPVFAVTFFQLWGGAGLATRYNYDIGLSSGVNFMTSAAFRLGVGFSAFTQQYNIYYDKENLANRGGSIRHQSMYAFFSPLLDYHLRGHGYTHFYITAGAGFKMSATDSLHKWSRMGSVSYDSTLGNAANANSMIVRVGMGLTHYFPFQHKRMFLTIGEDIGFLATKLSETTDPTNALLNNNTGRIYRPTYVSIRLGLGWKFTKKR